MDKKVSEILNENKFRADYMTFRSVDDAFRYIQGRIDSIIELNLISEDEVKQLYSINDKLYYEFRN